MRTLARKIKGFLLNERGGEMPEYAVVVGIIIVVGAAIFVLIGANINLIFAALNGVLGNALNP